MKVNIDVLRGDPPWYQSGGAACVDLYANWDKDHFMWCTQDCLLDPGETAIIPTGIRVAIPEGYVGLVCARSGLAVKGIQVANAPGVIDSDFRGEIGVILFNSGTEPYRIEHGNRIAQLMIIKHEQVEWNMTDSLDDTERSRGGFGSTGK